MRALQEMKVLVKARVCADGGDGNVLADTAKLFDETTLVHDIVHDALDKTSEPCVLVKVQALPADQLGMRGALATELELDQLRESSLLLTSEMSWGDSFSLAPLSLRRHHLRCALQ